MKRVIEAGLIEARPGEIGPVAMGLLTKLPTGLTEALAYGPPAWLSRQARTASCRRELTT